ncbi:hypothetical protein GCM10009717_18640 [Agromyces allii]|uniref:Uncharacterized protein n=1 Tax=Agromyces allii TaxID=393607 RepID=A0ABN2QID6_9MICO
MPAAAGAVPGPERNSILVPYSNCRRYVGFGPEHVRRRGRLEVIHEAERLSRDRMGGYRPF